MSIVNPQILDAMRDLFTEAASRDSSLHQWSRSFVMSPNACSTAYLIFGECDKLTKLLPPDLAAPPYLSALTLWMGPIRAWAQTQDFAEHVDNFTYFDYWVAAAARALPPAQSLEVTLNGFILSDDAMRYASRAWMLTASQHYAEEFKFKEPDTFLKYLQCIPPHLRQKNTVNRDEQQFIFHQTIAFGRLVEEYTNKGKARSSPWWRIVRESLEHHLTNQLAYHDIELNTAHSHILLDSPLIDSHKVNLLSCMSTDMWMIPELVPKIHTVLHATESTRFARMPFKIMQPDFVDGWMRTYCPNSYPLMALMAKPEDWSNFDRLKEMMASLKMQPDVALPLPEDSFEMME